VAKVDAAPDNNNNNNNNSGNVCATRQDVATAATLLAAPGTRNKCTGRSSDTQQYQ